MRVDILRVLALAAVISVVSCTKKDPENPTTPTDPNGTSKVLVEFSNKVGTNNLVLNDQWYQTAVGDSFKVSKFNYYISNVKLGGAASYTESDSYHLVQQGTSSSHNFALADVPYGKYNTITLTIGVDSARNTSGAQTGALDPANDMFWTWSTGYIMLKLEGTSPKSTATGNVLTYHAGGFKEPNSTQRTVTLTLPSEITVAKTGENHIHIEADVLKVLSGTNTFDFATMPVMTTAGANAKKLADNYAKMLSATYAGL